MNESMPKADSGEATLRALRRSVWLVYAVLMFGLSTVPSTLLGTLLMLLAAGPACFLAIVACALVWRQAEVGARFPMILTTGFRAGLGATWRSVLLVLPIVGVTWFQPHIYQAFKDPAYSVIAWPGHPPSIIIVGLLLFYTVVAVWVAARAGIAKSDRAVIADGHAPHSMQLHRVGIVVVAAYIVIAGAHVAEIQSVRWALAWPAFGMGDYFSKVQALWLNYDQSRVWTIAVPLKFNDRWRAEILSASFRVNSYHEVRLTPNANAASEASKTTPWDRYLSQRVISIVIHDSSQFGEVEFQKTKDGSFDCIDGQMFGLTICRSHSIVSEMPAAGSYAAELIATLWRKDPVNRMTLSPEENWEVTHKGTYYFRSDTVPLFLTQCVDTICTWWFRLELEHRRAGIEVKFPEAELANWKRLSEATFSLLMQFHVDAQAGPILAPVD